MKKSTSELGPIDPSSVPDPEKEKEAPWIVRKLAGSMTGRIVMSSYETLRATGTSVVCLSPWGDSSPLLLPCIRFRDLAMHAIIAGTGGMAAVIAPVMFPVSEVVIPVLGDTIAVEIGLEATFSLSTKAANDLIIEHPLKKLIPSNDRRLYTTSIKTLTITLKFKQTITDAALGFFRSSVHSDSSLFSSVKDYLSIEKGWMSPVLFASNRRPIIPRTMMPDVVFCHGPFLSGDYRVAATLLEECATVITLCADPSPEDIPPYLQEKSKETFPNPYPKYRPISNYLARRKAEKEAEKNAPPPPDPSTQKRRLLILLMGIKPHRTENAWSTSHRPGESIIRYLLMNGVPAVIVPVKQGCPLIAWNTLTLENIWDIAQVAKAAKGGKGEKEDVEASMLAKLTADEGQEGLDEDKLDGALRVLAEYLELCIDWDRVVIPSGLPLTIAAEVGSGTDIAGSSSTSGLVDTTADQSKVESFTSGEATASADSISQIELPQASSRTPSPGPTPGSLEDKKEAVKRALGVLVAGAVKAYESKAVKKGVDADRAGIAMLRLP